MQNTRATNSELHPTKQPTLFSLTGKLYFPITLIGRLPYAMIVVGVLTLVVSTTESYGNGGLASMMVGLGAAAVSPFLGAIADRIGQRPVLLASAVLNSIFLIALVWVSFNTKDLGLILVASFLVGASSPQLAPMSRARLVNIIEQNMSGDKKTKVFNGTMSYESTADEAVFVFGPVAVGLLASYFGVGAPIILAAAIVLIFVGAFALHPTATLVTNHKDSKVRQAPVRELLQAKVVVLIVGMLAIGFFFGATLTSLTSFMGVYADTEQSGIIYGALSVGSATLALSVAFFPKSFTLSARWLVFALLVFLSVIALPWVDSVAMLTVALIFAGFGIGPCLVTVYSLGSIRGPEGRSNTIMTLLASGIVVGQSLAAALTGQVADSSGHVAALTVTAVSGGALFIIALLNAIISRTD